MTGIWTAVAGVGAAAAIVSLMASGVMMLCGPVHPPKKHSAHAEPTPESGGLGVLLGVGAALAAWLALGGAALFGDGDDVRLAALVVLGAAAALLGFVDDVFDLPAGMKFVLIAALSVAAAVFLGPARELPAGPGLTLSLALWPAVIGSALWVFTATNAVNFMDGANGLVGGSGAIAAMGLAIASALAGAGTAAVAAAALAGGLVGFLPWNAPKGRVFLGDTGSLLVGLWLAGAGLLFVRAAPSGAVYLGPVLIMALLADVLLTLLARTRRGEPVFSGHKDHAYQHLMRAFGDHGPASRRMWRRTLLFSILAVDVVALAPVLGGWTASACLGGLVLTAAAATSWWLEDRRSARQ